MTGLSSALSTAVSGLSASSRRADVTAENIANANTPGYVRRSVSVSERVIDGSGAGVTIDGIARSTDPILTGQRRRAEGAANRDEVVANTLQQFNTSIGEPGEPFALFSQFTDLETALRDLAETPELPPLQNQVVDGARALATNLNRLSTEAQEARQSADRAIASDIAFVNNTLEEIAELNASIAIRNGSGGDVSGLLDQRSRLVDQVSEVIPVRELSRSQNRVDIMTEEGVFLVAGDARTIEFTQTGAISAGLSLQNGDLSGLTVDGVDITPGSGAVGVSGGRLAGNFAVRDQVAPDFQQQLDGLARDVVERFQNADPTLTATEAGLFTDLGARFDPAAPGAETGLASRIRVNALADPDQGGFPARVRDGLGTAGAPGAAGDPTIVRAMLDEITERQVLPANLSIAGPQSTAEAFAAVTSALGSARVRADTSLTASSARAEGLRDAELGVTGVDTDAELQRLLAIEQSFAANARVIQVIGELFEQLTRL